MPVGGQHDGPGSPKLHAIGKRLAVVLGRAAHEVQGAAATADLELSGGGEDDVILRRSCGREIQLYCAGTLPQNRISSVGIGRAHAQGA